MHLNRNKPLLLNSLELLIIKSALSDWKEPDNLREEKAVLMNLISSLEYIDLKDKIEEQRGL